MPRISGPVDQCPVCRTPLFAGYPDRPIVLCSSCRCAHHRDCWSYAGTCSQFACGSIDSVAGKAVFQEDHTEDLEAPIPDEVFPPGLDGRSRVETRGTIGAGDPLIYVAQTLLQRIVHQADERAESGVAGILTGARCSWLGAEFTRLDDALPFLRHRSAASLLSNEAWRTDLEKKPVLGWWAIQRRTRMSLEAQEVRLQELHFSRPWMLCLMVNPAAQTLGFFGWKAGSIVSVGFRLVKGFDVSPL